MSTAVYVINTLLSSVLASVPIGTNLSLYYLFCTIMSGRLLASRGAIIPALADLGLSAAAVKRSEAALTVSSWYIAELLADYRKMVLRQGYWQPRRHHGYRAVVCDLTGFYRPHLKGCASKHYLSVAGKALPALTFALVVDAGAVGKTKLALPRHLMYQRPAIAREADFQNRAVRKAASTLAQDEVLVTDAGFKVKALLACEVDRFVTRVNTNFTARRNEMPLPNPLGRPKEYGEIVRPLERTYAGNTLAASPPDETASWEEGSWTVRAQVWNNLILTTQKPGATSFQCVAVFDPRFKQPQVLVNYGICVTAQTVRELYRDRWQVEKMPQASKQMLGACRAFVSGAESRYRLPELALLAGNILSYADAISTPVATGFWDRSANPTCGRLRRVLARLDFSKLPIPTGQFREKASVSAHLPKGASAPRKTKEMYRA